LITAAELLAASALPPGEARSLLAHALGVPRERLIAHPALPVAADAAARFGNLAQRRRGGEPLAYLRGAKEFYGRSFAVSPAVLIPRPDTETLVDVALDCLRDRLRPQVLELGTGSGCIGITLQLERPDARVAATDIASEALILAQTNAGSLGAQVDFRLGRWFEAAAVGAKFDLIVSNPPYIAAGDPHLRDLTHEPELALTDGADGLSCLAEIIRDAPDYLVESGWLVLEHGYDQAAAVAELLSAAGMRDIVVVRDIAGHERVTRARR